MTQTQQQNVPALRFPEFSGDWETARVGSLATKIGSGVTPKGGSDVYQDSGIPLLRSQNVRNNKLYLADVAFISGKINAKMQGSAVKPYDVLLNITGASIGRSCVVPSDLKIANVNQHVCIIRLDSNSSPDFLQSFLASHRGQKLIFQSQSGSGREGLNFENIKAFKTAFPTLPEQQKIASFLSSVDRKIAQLGQKKALLQQYKRGCMQKLFSQELRFKDAQGNDFPDWEEKRLGELGGFRGGGTPDTKVKEFWAGNIPWISSSDISEDSVQRISLTRNITEKAIKDSATKIIPPNSLLIVSRVGVGKFAVSTVALCTSQDFCNFTPVQDSVLFLAYWMSENRRKLLSLCQGTSIKGLTTKELQALKVQLPCADEQQKIADFLSSIDQKIDLVSTKFDHAKAFKKGLLQQMFI